MATMAGKLVFFAIAIIINKNPDAASESAFFFCNRTTVPASETTGQPKEQDCFVYILAIDVR